MNDQDIEDVRQHYLEQHRVEIAASAAVYSCIERWIGREIGPTDRMLVIDRGELVMASGIWPGDMASHVQPVIQAAKAETRIAVQERIKKLEQLKAASITLSDCWSALPPQERPISVHHDRVSKALFGTEARVIEAIGLSRALPLVIEFLCSELDLNVSNERKKLEQLTGKKGRPRDERAYAVAAALAKLYAQITGKMPTYSEGPDGQHGEYTPGLRDLFDAIGLERAALKLPATAAIKAVTEIDLKYGKPSRVEKGLFGLLSTLPT